MTQNTSTAVMARRVEAPDSLDYFPTPPWATRALVQHVLIPRFPDTGPLSVLTAWEPACGEGHMARPLAEEFGRVVATDVHGYGHGEVHDFLMPFLPHSLADGVDWVITNPPFRLAEAFITRSLAVAHCGCAVLVRTAFLESVGRFQALFRDRPPSVVAQFVERVPMVKGRVDKEAASATAYAWLVWFKGAPVQDPAFVWIPPCRRSLERPHDYGEAAA